MSVNISDLKNLVNKPIALEKDCFSIICNQRVKSFPDGLVGVLIETPEYDGNFNRRTEYSLLHKEGELLMYVNIHPQYVREIVFDETPLLLHLSKNHPGGGGHYQDRNKGYELLEQYEI